jgi:hypothetical protein
MSQNMNNAMKKAMEKADRNAKKAVKLAEQQRKLQHIINVKAAANAEGIPHADLHITQTKSVANIITAAKKRMTVRMKRAEKEARPPNARKAMIAAAKEQGFSNNEIGRVTAKMSLNNVLAAARKRVAAKTAKQLRNAERAQITQALRDAGLGNAKIRGKQTVEQAIAAARKRVNAKTAKQMRNDHMIRIKQAVLNAGVEERDFKYVAKKSEAELIANAMKRRNARTKKNTQRGLKQQIIDTMGMPEAVLKAALCSRAK